MASELEFEFQTRWAQIGKRLLSQNPEQIADALRMLEERDRDLEDNWPAPGTSGSGGITGGSFDGGRAGTDAINQGTTRDDDLVSVTVNTGDVVMLWAQAYYGMYTGDQRNSILMRLIHNINGGGWGTFGFASMWADEYYTGGANSVGLHITGKYTHAGADGETVEFGIRSEAANGNWNINGAHMYGFVIQATP